MPRSEAIFAATNTDVFPSALANCRDVRDDVARAMVDVFGPSAIAANNKLLIRALDGLASVLVSRATGQVVAVAISIQSDNVKLYLATNNGEALDDLTTLIIWIWSKMANFKTLSGEDTSGYRVGPRYTASQGVKEQTAQLEKEFRMKIYKHTKDKLLKRFRKHTPTPVGRFIDKIQSITLPSDSVLANTFKEVRDGLRALTQKDLDEEFLWSVIQKIDMADTMIMVDSKNRKGASFLSFLDMACEFNIHLHFASDCLL